MTDPSATVAAPPPDPRGHWPLPAKHPLLVALIVLLLSLIHI